MQPLTDPREIMAARRKALLLETHTLFQPEACKGLEGTHYTNCVFDELQKLEQTHSVEYEFVGKACYVLAIPKADTETAEQRRQFVQQQNETELQKKVQAAFNGWKQRLNNRIAIDTSKAQKILAYELETLKKRKGQKPIQPYFDFWVHNKRDFADTQSQTQNGLAIHALVLDKSIDYLETELQRLQSPAPAQPKPAPVVQAPATANSKPEISVDAAALIEYYTGNTITEQNSVQVAAKYGFTSKAIYTNYRNLLNKNYRQGLNERGKVQARNFLKSLETAVSLLEGEARERAETDLSLYKSSYNEIYG